MLRLYHYWSSVCSQKVRMCLAEKALEWESRHVDIFAFENYEPAYTQRSIPRPWCRPSTMTAAS